MKITFIGIGNVGFALAHRLAGLGHTVTVAARDANSSSVRQALQQCPSLQAHTVRSAVSAAEVVFLATPYSANDSALSEAGDLSGKILVDCTNPVGPGLTHGLKSTTSGAEQVQSLCVGARVVKAFTIYGYENFQDSNYPGYGNLRPAMLLAGNDSAAKQVVSSLCRELGWEPVDTGPLSMSLHLEHMTLLWIKMARAHGLVAGFVWAMLRR